MKKKEQTTLHLSQRTHDDLRKAANSQKKSMGEVVEQLMKAGVGEDRVQMEQAAHLLIEAVCEQLKQSPEWATEALISAGMGLPGATVFDRRIGHFSAEKHELGRRLALWLVHRCVYFLRQGRRVFLVCDSGTTVFWFLKALGEAIAIYFGSDEATTVDLENLIVVTNNIPGAESFVTYASHHYLPPSTKTLISDVVKCRLLAGTFLPEYVAVTGDDTNSDIQRICERGRRVQVDVKASKGVSLPPVFIGVTTGNWITVKNFEGTELPHLLARGEGHGSFKRMLLDLCDEVFVIAPLGKVLTQDVDTLNRMLEYSPDATDPHKKSYESVAMPVGKASAIKLVTTSRTKMSLLAPHSFLVGSKIGDYRLLDCGEPKSLEAASLLIEQVNHLVFPFDQFADETQESQTRIELPHEKTRQLAFQSLFFSIRSSV